MKTSSISRLVQAMVAVVAVVACLLAVSCKKVHHHSGSVNQEAVQQIGLYETYELVDLADLLIALSDEAAKHSAKSDTVTLVELLNMRSSATFPEYKNVPVVGYVLPADTVAVDSIFAQYGDRLPADLKLVWSFKPVDRSYSHQGLESYELIALRTMQGLPAMTGEYIDEATSEYDKMMGYVVNLKFTDAGSSIFSRLTGAHIGKSIAIVVKDKVYCYPMVNAQVDGGLVQITGNFTEEEANGLVDFIYGK
jgi:hypothetical protein